MTAVANVQRASKAAAGLAAPRVAATLPVPQIRDGHDLAIDAETMGATTLMVAVPYPDMAVGDKITFALDPLSGWPGWSKSVTLDAAGVGVAATVSLPRDDLLMMLAEQVEAGYRVARAGGESLESFIQLITIKPPVAPLLPVATIEGQAGTELDPSLFPEGLNVLVPLYPGAAGDDWVLLYWQGKQDASTLAWHRVTEAEIGAGSIPLHIGPEWLQGSVGTTIQVRYQYARLGDAKSSEPVTLTIVAPLVLPPPLVDDAQSEGGAGENKGYLLAANAISGALIDIPESVEIEDGAALELHWDGHAEGGRYVATAPQDPAAPRRFFVPPAFVAANMGGEAKRFEVFYRMTLPSGRVHRSDPFHLWVRPLPLTGNPQCRQAQGKPGISLQDVPNGADLYVTGWAFAAAGQPFTLQVEGITPANAPTEVVVRDAVPVSEEELGARSVGGSLPTAFLTTLKPNFRFIIRAKVSFDGGQTWFHFPSTDVMWFG